MKENSKFGFHKQNYKYLLIGLGINILGFLLMIGGASDDPNKFNSGELFSHVKITIAPALIVIGYILIIYSIMKKNSGSNETVSANKDIIDDISLNTEKGRKNK
jgi:hypothetical protein